MRKVLLYLKESAISVVPISVIVLVLGVLVGLPQDALIRFIIGSVMLIIGMSLFSLGAEIAMVPIGSQIGASLTKTKKLLIIVLLCFIVGFIITVAEPDLMVLAVQLAGAFNKFLIIFTVSVGVGVFLVIAMLRVVFQISLIKILLISYALIFILAAFMPKEFLTISFDSGGVTTGPMTVPIIIALGIGIASVKSGKNIDDNFGLVAVCSIGPIIAVLLLGLFTDTSGITPDSFDLSSSIAKGVLNPFFSGLPHYMLEVIIALLPILVFFAIYNAIMLKLPKKFLSRIVIGLGYVYVGFVVFLTGVSVGFAPFGSMLAQSIVFMGYSAYLIPIGIAMGFFIVVAEPAVHILNDQIEEVSSGTIKKRSIMLFLMLGMALAVGIAMIRVLTGVSIWWFILPGYAIALILTFFSPKVFTAIAFDSGGVASGPMTATFLLPFAVGASIAKGGNILTDAFGLVAMVAMMPLITIQLLGVISFIKTRRLETKPHIVIEEVIDLDNSENVMSDTFESDEVIDFDIINDYKIYKDEDNEVIDFDGK